MIVQTAPEGEPRFVIPMQQHMTLAGKFARAFGNDRFEPVEPREVMLHVIDHHDAGWDDVDAAAEIDPKTGFPYTVGETPFSAVVRTSAASPSFNEKQHAYCGLLSSMHSCGLFNGRYGIMDFVRLDHLAGDDRAVADTLMDSELARQEELKGKLAADPEAAAWIEHDHLFQNYKQLQFFDTLALYFNRTHDEARGSAEFPHVPLNGKEHVTVSVRREGPGVYSFAPFPFAEDGMELSFEGRYMTALPANEAESARDALNAAPVERQTLTFVAG